MKLSKTSWLILTAGIFIIVFASVGTARWQQVHEQNQLREELSLAERRLSEFQLEQLSSQQEELEQLSQTMAQFEAAAESIAACDTLFNIAKTCDVEITEINSSGLVIDDLEGITCSVLPLTAKVEGDISSLISFIIKLNGDFTTGVVKSADISISENTTEERSSADIQLLIYAYQGE